MRNHRKPGGIKEMRDNGDKLALMPERGTNAPNFPLFHFCDNFWSSPTRHNQLEKKTIASFPTSNKPPFIFTTLMSWSSYPLFFESAFKEMFGTFAAVLGSKQKKGPVFPCFFFVACHLLKMGASWPGGWVEEEVWSRPLAAVSRWRFWSPSIRKQASAPQRTHAQTPSSARKDVPIPWRKVGWTRGLHATTLNW